MKTLTISITDSDFDNLGFLIESLTFAEPLSIIEKEMSRQRLEKCIVKLRNYGLPNLTMEEITAEAEVVRPERHALNRE